MLIAEATEAKIGDDEKRPQASSVCAFALLKGGKGGRLASCTSATKKLATSTPPKKTRTKEEKTQKF